MKHRTSQRNFRGAAASGGLKFPQHCHNHPILLKCGLIRQELLPPSPSPQPHCSSRKGPLLILMVSEWKQLKLSSSLLVLGTKCPRDLERVWTSRDRIKNHF